MEDIRHQLMKVDITKETSVQHAQKQFNGLYPYLKIEFFRNFHKNNSVLKAGIITAGESFNHIAIFYKAGSIDLDKNRTVRDITRDFEHTFGLPALVFRKSGNVWVATSLTEDWTLEDQNKQGEQISSHFM
jgi:hypothetical protein